MDERKPDELPVLAWLYHDGPTREQIPHNFIGSVCMSFDRQPHYRNETPLTDRSAAAARIASLQAENAALLAAKDGAMAAKVHWERRAEAAERALDHVRQQAGIWKQEALTQKHTVDSVGAELGGIPDYGPIVASVQALKARAEAAEQQVQELREDAERYRWLRDVGDSTWFPMAKRPGCNAQLIDAAIDAAKKGEAA
jgi:hypothetical protein